VNVNPQLNNNGFNGLIQTIPDDGEFVALNQNAVDVLNQLNANLHQNQDISPEGNVNNNIPVVDNVSQENNANVQTDDSNIINQPVDANSNPEANPPANNNITDDTYPLLVSDETLGKINLDKEFLSALPKEYVIETIVNQLSM